MAWRKLGILAPRGERRIEAVTRAFELRDRLTDRERYLAAGTYYQLVEGDIQKTIDAYRTLLESYPDDPNGNNNLGRLYSGLRNYAAAETLFARTAQLDPWTEPITVRGSWVSTAEMQVAQGKIEEARASLDRYAASNPGDPQARQHAFWLGSSQCDYETAETEAVGLWDEGRGSAGTRYQAAHLVFGLHLVLARCRTWGLAVYRSRSMSRKSGGLGVISSSPFSSHSIGLQRACGLFGFDSA